MYDTYSRHYLLSCAPSLSTLCGWVDVEQVLFADETCDGTAQNEMGECRMDIMDSTLAYLGYDDTEAYGITWKVGGSLSVAAAAAAAVFVAL